MERKSKAEIKKMLEEMRKPVQEGLGGHNPPAAPNVAKKGAKSAKRGGTYRPKV